MTTKHPIKKLEQIVADMQSGFACGKQNEVAEGIVHLRTHNISLDGHINLDKLVHIPASFVDQEKYNLKKNDLVFNNTNSAELVGKTILIKEDLPYAFSNHLTRLRFTEVVLPEWVLFVFQMYWQDKLFEKMCTRWIGQAGVNQGALGKIEIPLPPLPIQKKIVAHLNEKIGALHQAQALRESVLADTEKILSNRLGEIFRRGKEEGWEEKTLDEIAPINRIQNKHFLPYVGMEDVESNTGEFLGSTSPKKVKSNSFHFDANYILYGRLRPYLNKVLLPDFEGHCSTEMFPILPNEKKVIKKFLWYFMNQKSFIDQAMFTNKGARMPRADMRKVMKFKISLPSLTIQKEIISELDILSNKIRALKQLQTEQLADMKRLENAYLREAFTQN